MDVARTSSLLPASEPLNGSRKPETPEETARQFEEVLVREFVKVMTKDLFKSTLQGEGGPAWVESYSDTQRDVMTDALTKHLVEQGQFGISELLLRKWGVQPPSDEPR
jgi:peptidoglycan hydrolase FlgJ